MPHTTVADYTDYTGQVYDANQQQRITYWLTSSERALRRLAGVDFYEVSKPESDASQDWIEATVRLTEQALAGETEDARDARHSPYSGEKIGDYSYTLKSGAAVGDVLPARVAEIVAQYAVELTNPALAGMALAHPASIVGTLSYGFDASRAAHEGGEQ